MSDTSDRTVMEIKGDCFGVRLAERGKDDPHITVQILVEDDGNWHAKDVEFSSYWIDDLMEVLKETKRTLQKKTQRDPKGGWRTK